MDSRKLKRLLDLKRRIATAKKGELAIARDAVEQAHEQLSEAEREQDERIRALASESELSMTELSERARFVTLAHEGVNAAKDVVQDREQTMSERQEDVVVATRDVHTFETLNERARDEQRQAAASAEQRAADDQAGARWSAKQ